MKILGNRILVSKVEEEKKDGFQVAEVQDSFVYKGRIVRLGTSVSEDPFEENSIVLFAKYSPDTQDIEHQGKKYKVVNVEDVIAIL